LMLCTCIRKVYPFRRHWYILPLHAYSFTYSTQPSQHAELKIQSPTYLNRYVQPFKHKHPPQEYIKWFFSDQNNVKYSRATNVVREIDSLVQKGEYPTLTENQLRLLMATLSNGYHEENKKNYYSTKYENKLLQICLTVNKIKNNNYYPVTMLVLGHYIDKLKRIRNHQRLNELIFVDMIEKREFGTDILPNIDSFGALIKAGKYAKVDYLTKCLEIMLDKEHMLYPKLISDIKGFGKFLNDIVVYFAETGKLDLALAILKKMRVSKSKSVFNIHKMVPVRNTHLLDVKGKMSLPKSEAMSPQLDKIDQILAKLREVHGDDIVTLHIALEHSTITALIQKLASVGRTPEAIYLYGLPYAEYAALNRIKASITSTDFDFSPLIMAGPFLQRLNKLIYYYCKQGLHHLAHDLYIALYEHEIAEVHYQHGGMTSLLEPNSETYEILFNAYSKMGDDRRLAELQTQQKLMNMKTTTAQYVSYIQSRFMHGDASGAVRTLHEMKQKNVRINSTVMNMFISGMTNLGKLDETAKFMEDDIWKQNKCVPSPQTYIKILNAFMLKGDIFKVIDLYFYMYYNFQNFRTSKLKWPFPSRIVVKQVITAMAKIMVTEEQSREVVKRIYKYHETPEGYYLGKHEKVLRQTICYHLVKMWERTQILKQEKNITEKNYCAQSND
jgi:hypothetical protein